ncbi:hypothetical protein B0H13DRAFT_1889868 [Mycena leptocephala]|nr:hypothetical protein B0H13DRAFT_1889868 [Mycena leptocephala]
MHLCLKQQMDPMVHVAIRRLESLVAAGVVRQVATGEPSYALAIDLQPDYFTFKQRAGYSLRYARDVYHDPVDDPSLTVPLPPSPLLPENTTIALPPLDTTFQRGTPEVNATQSPERTPSSETNNFLPISEMPGVTTDAVPFRCTFCATRVVTPCWYCMDCYYINDTWVCDACEQNIDTLGPRESNKRFAEDPDETHNIFHILVRVEESI